MNALTKKILGVVIIIIIIMGVIIYFQRQRIIDLKEDNRTEVKLRDALLDSITYYRNKNNEWVAEKLTIQETIKNLEKMYGQLNEYQKELLSRIKDIDKKNKIIVAALFEANVKIDSLLIITGNDGNVIDIDTTNKKINFNNLASKDTSFLFDIDVNKVLPLSLDSKPTMLFKSIVVPNKQFVEFHWKNDKKKGYPISCTVTNTNKYIKVTNLESYAIPPLNRLHLNPTGWQKFENFFIKHGRTITYIGVGAAGATGMFLLMK